MYKALLSTSLLAVVTATSACGSSSSSSAPISAASSSGATSTSPTFLTYDASTKTVNVLLLARYDYPTGRNFNGYANGAMVINVPVGWKVTVTCTNDDRSSVPEYHSCAAVAGGSTTRTPLPPEATTLNPLNGFERGRTATFTFTPTQAGNFRYACLVGNHEETGMWDTFNVTASGSPSISFNG